MEKDQARLYWEAFSPAAFGEGRLFIPGLKRLLQPEGLDAIAVRQWLKRTLGSFDITPTEWARKAKLAPSTLNKFLKSSGSTNLSATTISTLAQVMGEMIADDTIKYKYNSFTRSTFRNTWTSPVIAELNPKICTEKFEWIEDKEYYVTIPLPDSHINYAFGIEVNTDLYNEYPRGSVLICQPAQYDIRNIEIGQKYILHWIANPGGAISTSLRRVTVDPEGKRWLTRVPGDDTANAFFLEDILPRGYGPHAMVSFLVVASVVSEKWIGSFAYNFSEQDQ